MSDRDAFREAQQERREHGLKARHETREARAIRKAVAEEIALALQAEQELLDSLPTDDASVGEPSRLVVLARSSAFRDAALLAREIGSRDPE